MKEQVLKCDRKSKVPKVTSVFITAFHVFKMFQINLTLWKFFIVLAKFPSSFLQIHHLTSTENLLVISFYLFDPFLPTLYLFFPILSIFYIFILFHPRKTWFVHSFYQKQDFPLWPKECPWPKAVYIVPKRKQYFTTFTSVHQAVLLCPSTSPNSNICKQKTNQLA